MRLLNTQTEKLFQIIEMYGFNPEQFQLKNNALHKYEIIYKERPEFLFQIEIFPNKYFTEQCPGIQKYKSKFNPNDFNEVTNLFAGWLKDLKTENKTEDYWEYYKNLYSEKKKLVFVSNNNFTQEELKDLEEKLASLKEGLKTLNLLPEHLEKINKRLDQVFSYAKNMDRVNWKDLFIGAIIGCIINIENGKAILNFIQNGFLNKLLF